MFAELGFDGTSAQLIAQAAGMNLEAMVAQVGDKAQLYREVMLLAHRAEREAMQAALDRFAPTAQGLIELADAYFDFYRDHPHVLALWMHRWMGDAIDVEGLEKLYSRPLANVVADTVREMIPGDVDTDYLLWTIVWSVYGFLTGGLQHTSPRARLARVHHPGRGRDDVAAHLRFRAHLHTLIRRMTTPAAFSGEREDASSG